MSKALAHREENCIALFKNESNENISNKSNDDREIKRRIIKDQIKLETLKLQNQKEPFTVNDIRSKLDESIYESQSNIFIINCFKE